MLVGGYWLPDPSQTPRDDRSLRIGVMSGVEPCLTIPDQDWSLTRGPNFRRSRGCFTRFESRFNDSPV